MSAASIGPTARRVRAIGPFERYPTIRVALCIVVGIRFEQLLQGVARGETRRAR